MKKILPSAEQLRAKLECGEDDYDFYRCTKCGRLITRLEELMFFMPGSPSCGKVCPCGNMRYSPVNPKRWEFLFLPRVWKFAYYRIRGWA